MSENALAQVAPATPALLMPIAKPAEIMEAHKVMVEVIRETLEEGRDYGQIPGTDRKNLLKPGAERLVGSYGLRATYDILESEVQHDRETKFSLVKWVNKPDPGKEIKEQLKAQGLGRNKKLRDKWVWQEPEKEEGTALGLYRYVVRCALINHTGQEVGQGVGSCSSLESKYIRAPRDAENTVLKMAKKRAYVDAVLTTLGLSDRFTQDLEDITENNQSREREEVIEGEIVEEPKAPKTAPAKYPGSGARLKEWGWSPDQAKTFQDECAGLGIEWGLVVTEAYGRDPDQKWRPDQLSVIARDLADAGSDVQTFAGEPQEEAAEVEADPKAAAPENADAAGTTPASTSKTEQPEGDPFDDEDEELTLAPDDCETAYWQLCSELKWPEMSDAASLKVAGEILGRTVTDIAMLPKAEMEALWRYADGAKRGVQPEPATVKARKAAAAKRETAGAKR